MNFSFLHDILQQLFQENPLNYILTKQNLIAICLIFIAYKIGVKKGLMVTQSQDQIRRKSTTEEQDQSQKMEKSPAVSRLYKNSDQYSESSSNQDNRSITNSDISTEGNKHEQIIKQRIFKEDVKIMNLIQSNNDQISLENTNSNVKENSNEMQIVPYNQKENKKNKYNILEMPGQKLTDESEEEVFKEQCKLRAQQVTKKADLKIEFEEDQKNGLFRKIETRQIIVDYQQTEEVKEEIEQYKQTFATHFPIQQFKKKNPPQQLKGLKIQSIRHYNPNKMILSDQQSSQQLVNTNSFPYQSNIITQVMPLFDVSDHQQYLDTGKFKKFFEVLEELGRGGFGRVYKAFCKVEQKIYALKQIAVPFEPGQIPTDHKYYREVRSMNSLNHKNIVSYNTSWWEECDDDMVSQLQYFINNQNNNVSNCSSFEPQNNNNKSNQLNYQISNEKTSNQYNESIQLSCIEWEAQTQETKPQQPQQQNESNQEIFDKINKMESDSQEQYLYQEQQQSKYSKIHITKQSKILALFIQFEYCSGKTLRNYLEQNKSKMTSKESFFLFSQILEGVNYLHKSGFIHRDLKPTNIMLQNNVIKIGDFGLSIQKKENQENEKEFNLPELNLSKQSSFNKLYTGNVGTPFYMPPEQQNMSGYYDEKIDVYSLGIILLEIIYNMQTYHERLSIVNELKEKRKLPNQLNKEFKYACKLIIDMTHKLPKDRPYTDQILTSKTYNDWKKQAQI